MSNFPLSQMDISNVPTHLSKFLEVKSRNDNCENDYNDTNQPLTGQDICTLILHYPSEFFQGKYVDEILRNIFIL